MFKSLAIAAAVSFALIGCGGGSAPADNSNTAAVILTQPFTVVTIDLSTTISGYGDTWEVRALDAAVKAAATIQPGTTDYRLMLSDSGLSVRVIDFNKRGTAFIARIKADGKTVVTSN